MFEATVGCLSFQTIVLRDSTRMHVHKPSCAQTHTSNSHQWQHRRSAGRQRQVRNIAIPGFAVFICFAGVIVWDGASRGMLGGLPCTEAGWGRRENRVALLGAQHEAALRRTLARARRPGSSSMLQGDDGAVLTAEGQSGKPPRTGWEIAKLRKNGLEWDGKRGVAAGQDVVMVPPPLLVPNPPLSITLGGRSGLGGDEGGSGELGALEDQDTERQGTQRKQGPLRIPVAALEALEDMNHRNKVQLAQVLCFRWSISAPILSASSPNSVP